jgi:CheY-like chemotaxis protein
MQEKTHSNISIFSQISHEVRTPLTSIVGMLHILNESNLDEDQKNSVSFILKAVDELKDIDQKIKVILSKYTRLKMSDNLKKLKILLVEDHEMVRIVHKRLIENINGDVIDIAETGDEAFLKATTKNYNLIFMDIGLPDMDGIEVTRKIRDTERTTGHKSTIIGLTAYNLKDVEEKCLAAGMDRVMNKPAKQDVLKQLIDDCKKKLDSEFINLDEPVFTTDYCVSAA